MPSRVDRLEPTRGSCLQVGLVHENVSARQYLCGDVAEAVRQGNVRDLL